MTQLPLKLSQRCCTICLWLRCLYAIQFSVDIILFNNKNIFYTPQLIGKQISKYHLNMGEIVLQYNGSGRISQGADLLGEVKTCFFQKCGLHLRYILNEAPFKLNIMFSLYKIQYPGFYDIFMYSHQFIYDQVIWCANGLHFDSLIGLYAHQHLYQSGTLHS